jgi:hypothetical protein
MPKALAMSGLPCCPWFGADVQVCKADLMTKQNLRTQNLRFIVEFTKYLACTEFIVVVYMLFVSQPSRHKLRQSFLAFLGSKLTILVSIF